MTNKGNIDIILAAFFFFTPAIFLTYVYQSVEFGELVVVNGQYYFFISTVISGILSVYLAPKKLCWDSYFVALIVFKICLFVGVVVSNFSFENFRLFLIISMVSMCGVLVGRRLTFVSTDIQELVLIIGVIPCFFPTLAAFVLEFWGPLDIGIVFENKKHENYNPQRWHLFFSSANGYGLYAAISALLFYILAFNKKGFVLILYLFFFILAVFSLLLSGTRAAFLFLATGIVVFHCISGHIRTLGVLVSSFLVFMVCISYLNQLPKLLHFLRIKGDLSNITSSRFGGATELLEYILANPVQGMGFGAMDKITHINPTNIFYFGIFAEIGIVGFLGALSLIMLPILKGVRFKKQILVGKNKNLSFLFGFCLIFALMPYLFFEFNIIRVSLLNQIFFYYLGFTIFFNRQVSG